MGYPSRRESRPGAPCRLTACVLSLALVLQGTAPAFATVKAPPPAEALRDAVSAMGWVPPAPAAAPRLAPSTGPQAAFDALLKVLDGTPSADELRRAAAGAAAAAPASGREAARQWARTYGESAPAARAALPALARALGLTSAAIADPKSALASHDLAASRVAALALPDFGEVRAVQAVPLPAALDPAYPPLPNAALAEAELRRRLGQSGDLSGGATDADELARLDRLLERVSPLLPEGETGSGAEDSRESKWASLEALRRMFDDATASAGPAAARMPDLAGSPAEAAIAARLSRVEALNAELQANLAARDAAEAMLAVADRSRSAALRERRDGRDALEFRKNFARLAMVMDLSYSLNLLNSADAALGKMEALIDEKLKLIDERRASNGEAAADAGEQADRTEEWRLEAEAQTAADAKQSDDFAALEARVSDLSSSVERFRADVSGLLSSIDARDRGGSVDAPAEYDRRLALLPSLVDALEHGSSSDVDGLSDLSLDYLQAKSAEVAGYRLKVAEADARIGGAPIEFAGVLVIAVPGVPAESVSNPTLEATRALLSRRRDFWRGQRDEHATLLAAVERGLDPNGATLVDDDFGGSRLESLVAWRASSLELEASLASASDSIAADADALSELIEAGAPGAALPRLKGRSADELRTLLADLLDRLEAVSFPDTDAGFDAKTRKVDLSRLVPFLGDLTIRRLEAAATAKALEEPISVVLPKAKAAFTRSVAAFDAVLDDIAADEAWLTAGVPASQAQALIDRKRALINQTLSPMLADFQDLLDNTMIPFQRDRIAQSDPNGGEDGYATLYKEKKNLYLRIYEGLHKALPWGLASNGAKAYDAGAARAGIAQAREQYEDYKKIVVDYQDSMRRRKDPENAEMEDLYGEQVPYSLSRRAAVYREERSARTVKMNASAVAVNDILSQLDGLTANAHSFAVKYKLPVDLDPESPSAGPLLTSMADAQTLQNMASAIEEVADAALAASGSADLSVGGGSAVPTGTQPPLDVSANQEIALLGLEAIKRLVPTTASAATGDSYAECLARFLFADALVTTSDVYLKDRIPVFEDFLGRAAAGLDAGLADLDADLAWVGGDLAGGELVLDRKADTFNLLSGVAREGADLFGQKAEWSAEGEDTVDQVQAYYDALGEVYQNGDEALDAESAAALEFKDALEKSRLGIQEQRATVVGWLQQLDNPDETALSRVAQNLSAIQDRTRSVLETNIEARRAERARNAASKAVADTLKTLGAERAALDQALEPVGDLGRLSPEMASRVAAVGRSGPAWLAENQGGPQTMVIPKSQFERLLTQLFGALSADSAARDLVAIRERILKDPRALSQLLPGTKMVEVGEGTDGFYLVYQSEFSTPGGLETAQQVTFGNALKLWGQNVSVIGHRFASPPSQGNAPFGDQGVTVRIESLDSDRLVNYLDVTFHKFVQDIPSDLTISDQAREARMMVFDDFALMVADGKVYFGAAGFADFAATDAGGKPSYYGGSLKTKVKFSKVLSLNAEQTALFAKDPRRFLQEVNLDFTGYDPTLDQSFMIEGRGQDRDYARSKLGVGVDLAAALDTKDAFNLEFYYSKTGGTDPGTQQALGATILKGFTFDLGGRKARLSVGGGGELGESADAVNGRISFEVPDMGVVVSAQGKLVGSAAAYFAEIRKRTGENSELALSYGSRYIGLSDRLTVSFESSYTLGELWRSVTGAAAEDLRGGKTLAEFDAALSDFFTRDDAGNPALAELARAFDADASRRLIALEIGRLSREVGQLQKAGAFLDNIRQRAMVGFVSGPAGPGTAELATGGGFQAGTQTELTLSKSQRELVESRSAALFALGLDLEEQLLDTAKAWQSALAAVALAKWRRHLAVFLAAHAEDQVLRAEAEARVIESTDVLRRASLRYASLTGRGPDEPLPFDGVNPNDLDRVLRLVARALASPERLGVLFARARASMKAPEASPAALDWVPWIEQFTLSVGAQLPDLMSSQALGVAVTVRLPIHDPMKGKVNAAFELQSRAAVLEMSARLKSTRLRARAERIAARGWNERARDAEAAAADAARELSDGIRLFRNALIGAPELRARARRWLDAATDSLTSAVEGSLHDAWASLDYARQSQSPAGETREEPKDMNAAFDQAVARSASWEALARRSQAARELLAASDRRIRKVDADLSAGANITAAGVALIPAFGLTGLFVLPVAGIELAPEELRELDAGRRGDEAVMYTRLRDKAAADMAFDLTRALLEASYAAKQSALYESELIPALEAAQDGTPAQAEKLRAARASLIDLRARRRSCEVAANHLLGRPLDSRLILSVDAETALAALAARSGALDPTAATRDALESRLKIARAVETEVDKGLRVDRLRLDPLSMVARSLGRLIAALSGDGAPSPEIVAIARERTLAAERALEAFDQSLPVARDRLASELSRVRAARAALAGRADVESRALDLELSRQESLLRAQASVWGGAVSAEKPGTVPGSYSELQDRLREAALRGAPERYDFGDLGALEAGAPIAVTGSLRYYDHRQTLSGEPVGKSFVEGWLEARLRSPSTSPEAMAALARLREERADEGRRAGAAAARARADMTLARLRFDAALLRWSQGAGIGAEARERAARDLAEVAALLNLPPGTPSEALLALLPAPSDGDLAAAVAREVAQAEAFDLELLKKTLFTQGLPEELAGRDRLPQLRADLLAEKMSSRGFTPVAAVGLFRGTWVQGAFLEAPDPERVRAGLVSVIDDALRRELEDSRRLQGLALLLHSLMASVAEKTRLVAALRLRELAARRDLLGAVERVRLKLSPVAEIASAQGEAVRAQFEFVDATRALAEDFARLTAELSALAVAPSVHARPRAADGARDPLEPAERTARERLLAWWADRLLDEDFERRNGALLAGAPESIRSELRVLVERYRIAALDSAAVKSNGYDPAERLDRLMKADLQGRRRLIEGALSRILLELQSSDPSRGSSWTGLMGFLRRESAAAAETEGAVLAREGAVGAELSRVYWAAVKAPPALDKPVRRLIGLDADVSKLRRAAQAAWLSRSDSAQDHLLKDKALDAYVSALDAFDAELARTLELPETAADAGWTRSLNGLFGVRESLARRRDRLKYGRGMLTLEAAIALGESRLRALRFDPSETREIGPASETVAFLRGMKARWIGRTDALPALVALRGDKGVTWSSPAEVRRLEAAGRVSDLVGRRFVAPELWVGLIPETAEAALTAGWAEVVEGDDAARERLLLARSQSAAAARRAALDRALLSTEVVLDGAAGSALSLSDLRRLEGEGRVLWFEERTDPRTGLRKAVAVPAARLRAPSELIALVRVDGPAPDPGSYPSLESLESSGASSSYRRAELGRAGLLALAEEARMQSLAARRAGWLKIKLSAWGFALDESGEVAAVYLDEDELSKAAASAADPKDPAHKWTFHRAADLSIGLDDDGAVASARLGARTIILGGGPATRWLGSAPLALETDARGRVRRVFADKASLSQKAGGWWLEDASGRVWKDTDAEYAPAARPKRWLDPENGFTVHLGREMNDARLASARDAAAAARHWAYSPGQWPDLVLEIPRGVVQIPIELITGRDPNQHGYLGRGYARRGEGGASIRRGPGGALLHAIDILGILADPVQRYFDPSQFPAVVDNDGALNPGDSGRSKDPRTVDGRLNLVFGSGSLLREARWAQEDREAARAEALAAFRGGARRDILETVRGRAGNYGEAYTRAETGRAAFLAALAELGLGADADGGSISADPRRAATDRVVLSYLLELGAEGQDARLRIYEEELKKLDARPEAKGDAFDAELAAAQVALSAALAARRAADAALKAIALNMHAESPLALRLASL